MAKIINYYYFIILNVYMHGFIVCFNVLKWHINLLFALKYLNPCSKLGFLGIFLCWCWTSGVTSAIEIYTELYQSSYQPMSLFSLLSYVLCVLGALKGLPPWRWYLKQQCIKMAMEILKVLRGTFIDCNLRCTYYPAWSLHVLYVLV